MAEKDKVEELPNQASQRGKAGISDTGRSVRDAVREGKAPDAEEQKTAHGESGYRLPDSFYKLDGSLEAQKQTGNERGLNGPHARDEPDKSDPATKASAKAAKDAQDELDEQREQREAAREAALTPSVGVPTANKDADAEGKPRGRRGGK